MAAQTREPEIPHTTIGYWVWLFPLTYLLHLSEEYWGGEGFPAWVSRVAGAQLSKQDFITLNAYGLMFMIVSVLLIRKYSWRWLLVALGGIVLLNGVLHLLGTLVTRSYSPGLFSGMLCWIPLGATTFARQWQQTSRKSFVIGIIVAIGLHALISALALFA